MNNVTDKEISLLGRELSVAELELVAGGMACTPSSDGCADDLGNDVPCFPSIS